MSGIIITVTDENEQFEYDLEVPIDVKASLLMGDVLEVLRCCDPRINYTVGRTFFISPRMQVYVKPDESFEEAGIWNGDKLVIKEV